MVFIVSIDILEEPPNFLFTLTPFLKSWKESPSHPEPRPKIPFHSFNGSDFDCVKSKKITPGEEGGA